LALFGVAVVALTLLILGTLLYALFSRGVNTDQDNALRVRAHDAAAALQAVPDVTPQAPVAPANLKDSADVFLEVLSPDGSVRYSTAVLDGSPPVAPPELLSLAQQQHGSFATRGQLRLYVLPYAKGYVMTGQSTRVPQSNLAGLLVFLFVAAVPALLAALLASWLVAGRALRPLRTVARTADDIGRTRDFGRRLPEGRSRDEVAVLSSSFNRMLGQLQDAFESQRRFVADASHELRTPLTTIQGNAGLLARGRSLSEDVQRASAADIAEESTRMARLVDRMLTLARADAGLDLRLTSLDLAPVVNEVCRQAAAVHPEHTVRSDAVEAMVSGDEDALRQLLWILLDNAFHYARTTVEVRLSTEPGWARLIVNDDGPGISAGERERVFERFYRADPSRTGHGAGLGLAIARWVVHQHHGRILAGASTLGGAALLVDLPLLSRS
jgi:signal transduction histidine kinase